jgi:hypothetical protein
MKWITREHANVDRIAWLIKNFVDKDADFLFVAADKVTEIAGKQNAIPFDIRDVEIGLPGNPSSFDALIKKYELDKKKILLC